MSYEQAKAYCDYRRKRLPTEAEWLYAALGSDGRSLPWGEAPFSTLLCRDASGERKGVGDDTRTACSVGRHPAGQSPFGVLDAAGNVAEWTSTKEGDDRVVLGGHYQPCTRIESFAYSTSTP